MLPDTARWQRRARPLLGTLVEIGVPASAPHASEAIEAAFAAVCEVQACLSRFEPDSDVGRFHALEAGEQLAMRPATRAVLTAAHSLRMATEGLFDITLGSSPHGWCCTGNALRRLDVSTRLDLGGIGKGHGVDCAVDALVAHGVTRGWVNAGGDLRAFGDVNVPICLRDEAHGGARPFADLSDGAFATSHFGPRSRCRLAAWDHRPQVPTAHVSVAAPLCLWADALTKVAALKGLAALPVLARFGAQAWFH